MLSSLSAGQLCEELKLEVQTYKLRLQDTELAKQQTLKAIEGTESPFSWAAACPRLTDLGILQSSVMIVATVWKSSSVRARKSSGFRKRLLN
jgi:hypothetical protein